VAHDNRERKLISGQIPFSRPVGSHNRAGENILEGPPNISMEDLWGENFITFSLKRCILVYFIYLNNSGPPKRRSAWGSLLPYLTISMGLPFRSQTTESQKRKL